MKRNIQAKEKKKESKRMKWKKTKWGNKEETNFVVIFHWFCEETPPDVFLKHLDIKTDFDILKKDKKEIGRHIF
jgi:hypothetical protein